MRHYEIMLLVHPDRSDQVSSMCQRYTQMIEEKSGKIHRLEDYRLACNYPIQKLNKAHYILMNVECEKAVLQELQENFQFNDAILLNSILKQKKAITEPSIILTKLNAPVPSQQPLKTFSPDKTTKTNPESETSHSAE